MLTRRDREFPSHKSKDNPFADKAWDLQALRDAVVDAATVGTGLWLSYLFVLFYFAIAAGAVTHRDLLLENSVKLPFLNVELPLKAFFVFGPLIFLIVHTYVLLHFVLLAGKSARFTPSCRRRSRMRTYVCTCAGNCRATFLCSCSPAHAMFERASWVFCCVRWSGSALPSVRSRS
jgi:hypothetical protein